MAKTTDVHYGPYKKPMFDEGRSPQTEHMAPKLFGKELKVGNSQAGDLKGVKLDTVQVWKPKQDAANESPRDRIRRHREADFQRQEEIRRRLDEMKNQSLAAE